MPLPYPRLVVADVHVHERNNKSRIREVQALLEKIEETRTKYNVKSLIVCGDLFDNNSPLSVSTIVMLARAFRAFDRCVIIVGNHDTPIRSTSRVSMLEIFSIAGIEVIHDTKIIGSDLFVPYFAELPEEHPGKYDCLYLHKDIAELNGYCDVTYGLSLNEIPACKMAFNGHLHGYRKTGGTKCPVFIQCGAPYPTSWADKDALNNFIWLQNSPTEYYGIPTNILADAVNEKAADFRFLREREQKADGVFVPSVEAQEEDVVEIHAAIELVDADAAVKKIVNAIVAAQKRKVWKETV